VCAGPPGLGWYSYDLKGWHIISLNSEHVNDAAQLTWLENDLRETSKPCIIAYWHHPLFSSGDEHGDQSFDKGRRTDRFWRLLLAKGADVVLNGHDHDYERFDPQNTSGAPLASGLREFVVGTGGGEPRGLGTRKANSVFFDKDRRGVLLMTLHPNSYEWRFSLPTARLPTPAAHASNAFRSTRADATTMRRCRLPERFVSH